MNGDVYSVEPTLLNENKVDPLCLTKLMVKINMTITGVSAKFPCLRKLKWEVSWSDI